MFTKRECRQGERWAWLLRAAFAVMVYWVFRFAGRA